LAFSGFSYKKFSKDAATIGAAGLALNLKGLIMVPILTKSFGTVNYGVWAQVGVIGALLTPLVIMGLNSAMLRFLPGKSKEEIRKGFHSSLFAMFSVAAILCFVLVFFSKPIAEAFFGGGENYRFVILAGAVVISSPLTSICISYFRWFAQMRTYSALIISLSVAHTGAALAVVLLGYGIYELVVLSIALDILVMLVSLGIIVSQIGITFPRFTVLKPFFIFGLPLIPTGFEYWVVDAADRLFISYFIGMSALGIYVAVYSVTRIIVGFFFRPILGVLAPAVSRLWNEGKKDDVKTVFKYSFKYGIMFAIPIFVGFSLLGKPFFTSFTTAEFAIGYYLIPILSCAFIFHLISNIVGTILHLAQKTKVVPVIFAACAVVNLALNALLIPTIGLVGAAIATAVAFFVEVVAVLRISSRYFSIDYEPRFVLKSLISSLVMGLVVWRFDPSGIAPLILCVFSGAVIYFIILIVLKGFTRNEFAFFIDFIPGVRFKGWLLSKVAR